MYVAQSEYGMISLSVSQYVYMKPKRKNTCIKKLILVLVLVKDLITRIQSHSKFRCNSCSYVWLQHKVATLRENFIVFLVFYATSVLGNRGVTLLNIIHAK